MVDLYNNYFELSKNEKENIDFRIVINNKSTNIAIVAPHGGDIEPGTSEIAISVADGRHSCYCFEGIKSKNNKKILHITSTNFNEPECIKICKQNETIVTIHGAGDAESVVYIGGLNENLKAEMLQALQQLKINAKIDNTNHSGQDKNNLCNIGISKKGLQLEISKGMRKMMFDGLTANDRKKKKKLFHKFVGAVQEILSSHSINTRKLQI